MSAPGSERGIEGIMDRLRDFREVRGWEDDHTPINLAISISIEGGELLELFQWDAEPDQVFVAGEVADVLIYALNLCQVLGIDPAKAINDKISTNELRFPGPGASKPVGGC
jgi:dCTP diphosphatase